MKKIIFWGTPQFSLPSLRELHKKNLVSAVVTQPARPAGRGKKIIPSPVSTLAGDFEIPVLSPDKLDEKFISELKKYLPATFVVVAYGKIIPQKILDLSEWGALNIHPSLLPVLRGPSPIQSAIWQGFTDTGVSLMVLDHKMDHGPLLAQIKTKIGPAEGYIELSERLSSLGGDLLADNIEPYLEGKITPHAQDDSAATTCRLIEKTDGLIDWKKSNLEIFNQIRALNPWPGTFCKLGSVDLKITAASLSDQNLQSGHVKVVGQKLFVGCSGGSLEILRCQPSGKKEITAADFLRGYSQKLL